MNPEGTDERPLVAITGRPNVGKSTLFNRLVGERISITDEMPGVTRDRVYSEFTWRGRELGLVDSGGIGGASEDPLHESVQEMAEGAVADADLIVLMVDGRTGTTDDDLQLARRLQKMDKPVVLAINKVDDQVHEAEAAEYYGLGFDDAVMISAISGRNVSELLDLVCDELGLEEPEDDERPREIEPDADEEEEEHQVVHDDPEEWAREQWGALPEEEEIRRRRESREGEAEDLPGGVRQSDLRWLNEEDIPEPTSDTELSGLEEPAEFQPADGREELPDVDELRDQPVRLVFVGRRNAGKSSLTNMLLDERRALVSDIPGTTRDSLTAELELDGRTYELLDTAGMKKLPQIDQQLEYYAQLRAGRSLRSGEVAVLVIDAELGVTDMDKRVSRKIADEGKAVVVAVNKIDLFPERDTIVDEWLEYLDDHLYQLTWAPKVFTSATEGVGGDELLDAVEDAWDAYHRQIPDEGLNLVLKEALKLHPPPVVRNQPVEFHGVTQVGVRPPSFRFELNDEELLHSDYRDYLANHFRENFPLDGTNIRLFFHSREPAGRDR